MNPKATTRKFQGMKEFQRELDFLYQSYPHETDYTSKAIFAAVVTMQLRRKGYSRTMVPVFDELGVKQEDVRRWYKELFGDTYYGPKKKPFLPFDSVSETLTPREATRRLRINLGHLYVAIEECGLPTIKRNGIDEIQITDFNEKYIPFFEKNKPITTASKIVGADHKVTKERITTGMVHSYGKSPYTLVNVDELRVAVNKPLVRKSAGGEI